MMKNILIILLSVFLMTTNAQITKKALFLGNSYTAVNNLPVLVQNLATANGDILIHDKNTPGGMTFNGHSSNATSIAKIQADEWDFVVLQAQSQEPSFPPAQVAIDTKPYAQTIVNTINTYNSCTKAMFFLTWGRQNGDQQNCQFYPPICTYTGMQQRLRESYLEMTADNNADCAPVGIAWKKMREDFPSVNLYSSDGSHPSITGSYLAACVFYTSMYNKTTVGNSFISTLDSLTAYRIQTIATATVLDSLSVWSIETSPTNFEIEDSVILVCDSFQLNGVWYNSNTLVSDTTMGTGSCSAVTNYDLQISSSTIDSSIVSCGDLTLNGIVYTSDTSFKDTVSTSPCLVVYNYDIVINDSALISNFFQIHLLKTNGGEIILKIESSNSDSLLLFVEDSLVTTFSSNGFFTYFYLCPDNIHSTSFMLVAMNNCNSDTSYLDASCEYGAIAEIDNYSSFRISPNPTNNIVRINSEVITNFSASIMDISGKELLGIEEAKNSFLELDVSNFERGMYFVILYDENNVAIGQKRIVIND